jgi:hypothetical protein
VAGRQGDYYILPILEGSASIARDCKRDIYSRFLHINLYTYIHIYIFNTFTTIYSCILIITSYYLYTCNRLLLHLIIVYLFLICILLLLYIYILLNFDGFSASTLQRQVEMMLIYMKLGSLEPSISLELQSLDYK